MSNISKEALERARKRKYTNDNIGAYLAEPQFAGWTTFVAIIEQLQAKAQELDALLGEVATLLDTAANTNVAEIGEIERLIYDARDKIKQARGA